MRTHGALALTALVLTLVAGPALAMSQETLTRAYRIDLDAIIAATPTLTLWPTASLFQSADEPTSGAEPTPDEIGDTSTPLVQEPDLGLLGVGGEAPVLMAAATPADPRRSYGRLLAAARSAASGTSRDCYRTTVRTAHANGASGDGMTWPTAKKYQGRALSAGLRQAIDAGHLKPGMVIYMNLRPGTDPNSLDMSNLPHWMTYLGQDAGGVHRFADQYASDFSLDEVVSTYSPRKLDEILDPYLR